MLSVSTVITTYKSAAGCELIVPTVAPVAGNALLLVAVLGVGVMAMRFIDPVGSSRLPFFLALAGVTPAWDSVRSCWRSRSAPAARVLVQLPEHLDRHDRGDYEQAAYTDADRVRLATVYAVHDCGLVAGVATGTSRAPCRPRMFPSRVIVARF